MAKITLYDLASGNYSVDLLNTNFALIASAFENTVSRDGTAPNPMGASLDMNSNRILNLPSAADNSEPVTLGQLTALSTLNLYTPENHNHLWADISDKPATFTPTTHTHVKADVTDLVADLASLDSRLDAIEAEVTVFVQAGTPTANATNDLWFW